MDKSPHDTGPEKPRLPATPQGAGWLSSLGLGLFLFFVYLINGRDLGSDDTCSATLGTVVFSIAVQLIGAFCYPNTWNAQPRNVDLHHERLWDWRDTELSRSLIETFLPTAR